MIVADLCEAVITLLPNVGLSTGSKLLFGYNGANLVCAIA